MSQLSDLHWPLQRAKAALYCCRRSVSWRSNFVLCILCCSHNRMQCSPMSLLGI